MVGCGAGRDTAIPGSFQFTSFVSETNEAWGPVRSASFKRGVVQPGGSCCCWRAHTLAHTQRAGAAYENCTRLAYTPVGMLMLCVCVLCVEQYLCILAACENKLFCGYFRYGLQAHLAAEATIKLATLKGVETREGGRRRSHFYRPWESTRVFQCLCCGERVVPMHPVLCHRCRQ